MTIIKGLKVGAEVEQLTSDSKYEGSSPPAPVTVRNYRKKLKLRMKPQMLTYSVHLKGLTGKILSNSNY